MGTFAQTDPEHIKITGTECGYRMYDCASFYKNEDVIGAGLNAMMNGENSVKREELYIVSKVWWDEVEDCEAACRRSLERL